MTLFIITIIGLWLLATVFAALRVAADADALARELWRKQNRRKHNLGKWLKFHGGIK
jgi:hypothetical protein